MVKLSPMSNCTAPTCVCPFDASATEVIKFSVKACSQNTELVFFQGIFLWVAAFIESGTRKAPLEREAEEMSL